MNILADLPVLQNKRAGPDEHWRVLPAAGDAKAVGIGPPVLSEPGK
jgi:hypothetical protein